MRPIRAQGDYDKSFELAVGIHSSNNIEAGPDSIRAGQVDCIGVALPGPRCGLYCVMRYYQNLEYQKLDNTETRQVN